MEQKSEDLPIKYETEAKSEPEPKDEPAQWDKNATPTAYPTKTEEEEEEKYFCAVCEHYSYSIEAYQEHVVSQEHVNRAARVFHLDIPTKKQLKEENKDKEIHHCNICDINCHGEICWTAHLAGAKHRKKEKLKQNEEDAAKAMKGIAVTRNEDTKPMEATINELLTHKEPLIGLEHVIEIQVENEPLQYECTICDCKFDGNLKIPHLVGIKHRYAVVKLKYPHLGRQVSSSEKRSVLNQKLSLLAQQIEEEEGRKHIKAIKQSLVTVATNAKNPGTSSPNAKEESSKRKKTTVVPKRYREERSPRHDDDDERRRRDGSRSPIDQNFDPKLAAPYQNTNDNMLEERPHRDYSRDSSDSDQSSSDDSSVSRSPPPPKYFKRSSSNERLPSEPSNSRVRSRSPSHRGNRSPPYYEHRRRSSLRRYSDRGRSPPRDISDEIQEEMKRQQRQAEEERRREERDRRNKLKAAEERRKTKEEKELQTKGSKLHEALEGRTIDEDTRRLVMQNLTELAKCCVTNEADAELALQVSNALTQALLQYRMRNMPTNVMQTLGKQQIPQQQQQQIPPQPTPKIPFPQPAMNQFPMQTPYPQQQFNSPTTPQQFNSPTTPQQAPLMSNQNSNNFPPNLHQQHPPHNPQFMQDYPQPNYQQGRGSTPQTPIGLPQSLMMGQEPFYNVNNNDNNMQHNLSPLMRDDYISHVKNHKPERPQPLMSNIVEPPQGMVQHNQQENQNQLFQQKPRGSRSNKQSRRNSANNQQRKPFFKREQCDQQEQENHQYDCQPGQNMEEFGEYQEQQHGNYHGQQPNQYQGQGNRQNDQHMGRRNNQKRKKQNRQRKQQRNSYREQGKRQQVQHQEQQSQQHWDEESHQQQDQHLEQHREQQNLQHSNQNNQHWDRKNGQQNNQQWQQRNRQPKKQDQESGSSVRKIGPGGQRQIMSDMQIQDQIRDLLSKKR